MFFYNFVPYKASMYIFYQIPEHCKGEIVRSLSKRVSQRRSQARVEVQKMILNCLIGETKFSKRCF